MIRWWWFQTLNKRPEHAHAHHNKLLNIMKISWKEEKSDFCNNYNIKDFRTVLHHPKLRILNFRHCFNVFFDLFTFTFCCNYKNWAISGIQCNQYGTLKSGIDLIIPALRLASQLFLCFYPCPGTLLHPIRTLWLDDQCREPIWRIRRSSKCLHS